MQRRIITFLMMAVLFSLIIFLTFQKSFLLYSFEGEVMIESENAILSDFPDISRRINYFSPFIQTDVIFLFENISGLNTDELKITSQQNGTEGTFVKIKTSPDVNSFAGISIPIKGLEQSTSYNIKAEIHFINGFQTIISPDADNQLVKVGLSSIEPETDVINGVSSSNVAYSGNNFATVAINQSYNEKATIYNINQQFVSNSEGSIYLVVGINSIKEKMIEFGIEKVIVTATKADY